MMEANEATAFRVIIFDWDGTAVRDRASDATDVLAMLDLLLSADVDIAVVTGTHVGHLLDQGIGEISLQSKQKLYLCTNRGSEVFGFNSSGSIENLYKLQATQKQDSALDSIADSLQLKLAQAGVETKLIRDRLNRRKIDLIPLADWSNPKKSKNKELLDATTKRLKSARLARTLQEWVNEASEIARSAGLSDARITSDIKHIEIGLSDKSDSTLWVYKNLIAPQNISPLQVAILGDEFGDLGGVPGSDSLMRITELTNSRFVSVGVEPEGVPPYVTHLPGGTIQFEKFLRNQIALHGDAIASLNLVPDRSWSIQLEGFDPTRERELETIFSIGNGYLGVRGSSALCLPSAQEDLILAGIYDRKAEQMPYSETKFVTRSRPESNETELVPVPYPFRIKMWVNENELTIGSTHLSHHSRALDLRRGILHEEHRAIIGEISAELYLRSSRWASLHDPHLLIQDLIIESKSSDHALTLRLDFSIHVEERESVFPNVTLSEHLHGGGTSEAISYQTSGSQERIGIAMRVFVHRVLANKVERSETPDRGAFERAILESAALVVRDPIANEGLDSDEPNSGELDRTELDSEDPNSEELDLQELDLEELNSPEYIRHLKPGEKIRFTKIVSVFSSRDSSHPFQSARDHARSFSHLKINSALADHSIDWWRFWEKADVQITGSDGARAAQRFNLYHLRILASRDSRSSIGARGLTGRAYEGHVFWDTEVFMFPFFLYTEPEIARDLLVYRYHTLNGARIRAREMGHEGACYAWESTLSGRDMTPEAITIKGADVDIPVFTGKQQIHVTADVAHAIQLYWDATLDQDFMLHYGLEILVETARFWQSRSEPLNERSHIRRVVGPDEYHFNVDDNAFTNFMAKANLRFSAEMIERFKLQTPQAFLDFTKKVYLQPQESQKFRELSQKIFFPEPNPAGVLEQHSGFFKLRDVKLTREERLKPPVMRLFNWREINEQKLIKQADILMIPFLYPDVMSPQILKANYDFYEPITDHGSSLSLCVHAALAARLGYGTLAQEYWHQSLHLDLLNLMSNTELGIHAAALGGTWQALVFHFLGISLREGQIKVTSQGQKAQSPFDGDLRLNLIYRGQRVRINARRDGQVTL